MRNSQYVGLFRLSGHFEITPGARPWWPGLLAVQPDRLPFTAQGWLSSSAEQNTSPFTSSALSLDSDFVPLSKLTVVGLDDLARHRLLLEQNRALALGDAVRRVNLDLRLPAGRVHLDGAERAEHVADEGLVGAKQQNLDSKTAHLLLWQARHEDHLVGARGGAFVRGGRWAAVASTASAATVASARGWGATVAAAPASWPTATVASASTALIVSASAASLVVTAASAALVVASAATALVVSASSTAATALVITSAALVVTARSAAATVTALVCKFGQVTVEFTLFPSADS